MVSRCCATEGLVVGLENAKSIQGFSCVSAVYQVLGKRCCKVNFSDEHEIRGAPPRFLTFVHLVTSLPTRREGYRKLYKHTSEPELPRHPPKRSRRHSTRPLQQLAQLTQLSPTWHAGAFCTSTTRSEKLQGDSS